MDSPQAEGESYPVEAVLSPGGEITGVQLSLTCGSTGSATCWLTTHHVRGTSERLHFK